MKEKCSLTFPKFLPCLRRYSSDQTLSCWRGNYHGAILAAIQMDVCASLSFDEDMDVENCLKGDAASSKAVELFLSDEGSPEVLFFVQVGGKSDSPRDVVKVPKKQAQRFESWHMQVP